MVTDESEHVRASLASVIMGCAPVLGRDKTIEHLVPLFLQLLKDDTSKVSEHVDGCMCMGVTWLAHSVTATAP